jgi:hypothetical protein
MLRPLLALTTAALCLAVTDAAMAQNTARCQGQTSTGEDARNQTFCFEAESVRGGVVGPNGQGVRVLQSMHGTSLIRFRAHFVPEMLETVERL